MIIPIHLAPEELALAERYAARHGLPLEEAFKQALFEKIEDEHDLAAADEAYQGYLADPKTYTHEEVKELFGL